MGWVRDTAYGRGVGVVGEVGTRYATKGTYGTIRCRMAVWVCAVGWAYGTIRSIGWCTRRGGRRGHMRIQGIRILAHASALECAQTITTRVLQETHMTTAHRLGHTQAPKARSCESVLMCVQCGGQ